MKVVRHQTISANIHQSLPSIKPIGLTYGNISENYRFGPIAKIKQFNKSIIIIVIKEYLPFVCPAIIDMIMLID